VLALLNGFPYPQSALVASHLVVFCYSHVYLLKRCRFFICVSRFSRVLVVILMSLAYPRSSYVVCMHVGVWDWCVGLYPLLPTESQLSSSSMNIVNRKVERISPFSVPLWMGMVIVLPCGVI
jgi:hypothetical protein